MRPSLFHRLPASHLWFTLLHAAILQRQCHAYHSHHHIYEEGEAEDACSAADFQPTYWTAPDARGTQLLGTQHAQKLIWEHQHPGNCSDKRFLVWVPHHDGGIGSTWHIMGQVLAHAIAMDRVLVLAEDATHAYFDAEWCGGRGAYHDCYFEPVSSCTLEDVEAALGGGPLNISAVPEVGSPAHDRTLPHVHDAPVVHLLNHPADYQAVPPMFAAFVGFHMIHPKKFYYWWRAQSVTYLMRPNARTLAEIEARKRRIYQPGRVERGCISVHIRRGDKWTESPNTDDATYLEAAERLYAQGAQPFGLVRSIFLSTEDPSAVEYFRELDGWDVTYTHVPRKPDMNKSTVAYAQEIGPANEMFNSLVNLDLALECEGWVGTLSSNWCRLIDELRSTVRCKAQKLYLDAQQHYPPKDFSWKLL